MDANDMATQRRPTRAFPCKASTLAVLMQLALTSGRQSCASVPTTGRAKLAEMSGYVVILWKRNCENFKFLCADAPKSTF